MSDNKKDFLDFVRTRETDCPVCYLPLKTHSEEELEACGFILHTFNSANGKEDA